MPVAPPGTQVIDRFRRPPMRLGDLSKPPEPDFSTLDPAIQNAIRNGLVPGWNPATMQADPNYVPGQWPPGGGEVGGTAGPIIADPAQPMLGDAVDGPSYGGDVIRPGGNSDPFFPGGNKPMLPDKAAAGNTQNYAQPMPQPMPQPPMRPQSGSSAPVKNPGASSRQAAIEANQRRAAKPAPTRAPGPAPGAGPFSLPHSQPPIGATAPPTPDYTKPMNPEMPGQTGTPQPEAPLTPELAPEQQAQSDALASMPARQAAYLEQQGISLSPQQQRQLAAFRERQLAKDTPNASPEVLGTAASGGQVGPEPRPMPQPGRGGWDRGGDYGPFGGHAPGVNPSEVTPGPTVDANGRPIGVAPGSVYPRPRPPMRLPGTGGGGAPAGAPAGGGFASSGDRKPPEPWTQDRMDAAKPMPMPTGRPGGATSAATQPSASPGAPPGGFASPGDRRPKRRKPMPLGGFSATR